MQHTRHARPGPSADTGAVSEERRSGREVGQALVEMAVALPIIILLIFGIFDAGRGVISFAELTNASRAGARVAIVNQSNDSGCASADVTFKCAAADVGSTIALTASSISDVTITGVDCYVPSNCAATVTIGHTFQPITPIIGDIFGPINLSMSTTMPIERTYTSP